MLRKILLPLSLVLAFAPGAQAQSVENALVEARLIGRWAGDCGRPPSGTNIHSVYALEPSGEATLAYESAPGIKAQQYAILAAKRVAPDRLQYEQVNRATGVRLTILLAMTATTIRVWTSQRASGELLVRDGMFTADGRPSPLQRRCN